MSEQQFVPLPPSALEEQKLALKNEQSYFGKWLNTIFDQYCASEELKTVEQQTDRIESENGLQFAVPVQGFDAEKARKSALWGQNLMNFSDIMGKYVVLDYELREADDDHAENYYLFTLSCYDRD
jgi:hypothetical protein